MPDEVIAAAAIGSLGPKLGEGGQARVYQAPGLRLPDASGPLVVKLYKPGHAPPHGLHKLVALRNGLDPMTRQKLDQFAVWPLRVVEDAGQATGVVMTIIPGEYFHKRVLPGSGRFERGPREVQNLLIPPDRARVIGMPSPQLTERLVICRDFAAALHFVHRHGLVVGDLNARNALFRMGARPSVLLVDCDAIRIKGNVAVVAQLNAPDWQPPERPLTQRSDLYKFGLFVLRCLGAGDQMSTTRDPARADAALDAEGRQLLRAALSDRPAVRPTAQDWGRYFQFLLTGVRLTAVISSSAPKQRTPETTGTPGWIRDPVTGRWTQR